jgi:hypothetical protein
MNARKNPINHKREFVDFNQKISKIQESTACLSEINYEQESDNNVSMLSKPSKS